MNALACILAPLCLGAVLLFLRRRPRPVRMAVALGGTCAVSVLCLAVALGGAAEPLVLFRLSARYTCALRLDGFGRVLCCLFAVLWPLAVLYGDEYMRHEEREGYFFAWYVMAYGAACGVATAANLFTLYIFYELLTLVTVPLVWHEGNKSSIRAARVYLTYLMGGAALGFAGLILCGSAGGETFTLGGFPFAGPQGMLPWAALALFVGLGAKAAVFPLCRWLPGASVAPTPVTALLHAVAVVNCGVFSVARALYYVLPMNTLAGTVPAAVMTALACVTILYASAMALREQHLKRRLAWSTVSNLSYMLLGLSLLRPEGLVAAVTHMIYHGVIKMTLFFCAGAVMVYAGRTQVRQMHGLGRRMPCTFACFTLASLALVGVPPLAGFYTKYYLISAALAQGDFLAWVGCVTLLISSILTALYTFSVVLPAFFMQPEEEAGLPSGRCDPQARMTAVLLALCVLLLALSAVPGGLHRILTEVFAL